jgi:hypothetical protein
VQDTVESQLLPLPTRIPIPTNPFEEAVATPLENPIKNFRPPQSFDVEDIFA